MLKSKSIFLSFIMLASISASRGDEVFLVEDGKFETPNTRLAAMVTPRQKVIIHSAVNLKGKINIDADSISEAVLEYRKILKTSNQSEAVDYATLIIISMDKTPAGLRILLQAPNPAPWTGTIRDGMVEATLRLPRDCRIEIDALYFDFSIEGPFRSVINKSSLGRLEVKNITEQVLLATSNRDVIARNVRGTVSIATANADIRINDLITGSTAAQIENEKGNIFVEKAAGILDIHNSYGKIKLDDIIIRAGVSRVMGQYSPIRLKLENMENGFLTISNNNSDVEIWMPDSISVKCLLSVGSEGEISVERLPALPTIVGSNSLGFISANGSSRADVSIEGDGNIYLKGMRPE